MIFVETDQNTVRLDVSESRHGQQSEQKDENNLIGDLGLSELFTQSFASLSDHFVNSRKADCTCVKFLLWG